MDLQLRWGPVENMMIRSSDEGRDLDFQMQGSSNFRITNGMVFF